jgi:hypothetical protein
MAMPPYNPPKAKKSNQNASIQSAMGRFIGLEFPFK